MSDDSVTLKHVTIHYGKTTPNELLDAGYSLEPMVPELSEYHSESRTAMCPFFRKRVLMGRLVFYDVAQQPCDDLRTHAIDLVLLAGVGERAAAATLIARHKATNTAIGQHAPRKILLSVGVHLIVVLLFYCAFTIPVFLQFLQRKAYFNGAPIAGLYALILITVPAIIVANIWSDGLLFFRSVLSRKRRLALSGILILNVVISVCYLVLLYIALKGNLS